MITLRIPINELSMPTDPSLDLEHHRMYSIAKSMLGCLLKVHGLYPNIEIVFPSDLLFSHAQGKTFSSWLKQWLGHDEYAWFQSKVFYGSFEAISGTISFVFYDSNYGLGLSCAHSNKSWTLSFPIEREDWSNTLIEASLGNNAFDTVANSAGLKCQVRNFSCEDHAAKWRDEILAWGLDISTGCVIASVAGHDIEMYPLDHGYPHIHLIAPGEYTGKNYRKTLAKYRIDIFERMEGAPRFDRDVESWISDHREELLHCWDRCRQGYRPFVIDA